jgi:hypothetical protein
MHNGIPCSVLDANASTKRTREDVGDVSGGVAGIGSRLSIGVHGLTMLE